MGSNLGNGLWGSDLVGWRASGHLVDQPLPDAPVVHDNTVFGKTVHFCRAFSVLHNDLLLLATVGAGPEVEPWVGAWIFAVDPHVLLTTFGKEVVDCFVHHCVMGLDLVAVLLERREVMEVLGVQLCYTNFGCAGSIL